MSTDTQDLMFTWIIKKPGYSPPCFTCFGNSIQVSDYVPTNLSR